MNDIPWNRIALAEFRDLACLSEEESKVLLYWVGGKSVTYTARKCGFSSRQVDNIRSRLRRKYDAVQPYTPLLPQREVKK